MFIGLSLFILFFVLLVLANETVGEKDVVPRDELLDVGDVDALGVPLGKSLAHELLELFVGCFCAYALFAAGELEDVRHDVSESDVLASGIHGDLVERAYAGSAANRGALAVGERLDDDGVFALGDELEKPAFA